MIAEGLVLLGVEHLKQCRGRVAVRVGGQLVDLVKQNERIFDLCLYQRVDDTSRHGGDVCLAVTAYISFVAHTAERYAHILAVHRMGY